jgi:hypothetical protein
MMRRYMLRRSDTFIMAFNDAFLVITIGLLVAAGVIWLCKKPEAKAAEPGG